MSDLGTARGRIEIDSSGAEAGFRKAEQAGQSTFSKMEAASGAMIKVGGVMAGAGAAIAGGIGLAIKAAASFESELSRFGSVSSATAGEMDKIREKALQIGRDTSFGAGEAAGAMTELAKAGLSTGEILEGAADATIALAEAGEIDVARAAQIAAAGLNTFKLEAKDLDMVANTFVGTANNSATSVEQLAEAMEQTGSAASTLGIPVDQVSTALGLLADRGITGGKAGTTLNRMLLSLQPSSEQAAEAMRELGLITEEGANQFFTASGDMKNLDEVSQILQDSLAGLSKEQKVAALETIFGSRAIAAATALAESGADGFNELAEAIGSVDAQEVAKDKLDNLSGAMTILKGTIETALISAGAPFQDALKGIVQQVTSLINAFASMDPRIQKFIVFAAAALAGVLLLTGGFLIMAGTLIKLVAVVSELGPVLKLVGVAFKTAAIAAKGFTMALLTNPIFLIIAAIVALAYAVYRYWDEITAFISAAWATIKTAAMLGIEAIKGFFIGLVNGIKNAWTTITEGASEAWASLKEVVISGVKAIFDWLKGNWKTVLLTILLGPFGLLIATVIKNWEKIKAGFKAGVQAVGRFMADLPRLIGYALGVAVRKVIEWSLKTIDFAKTTGRDFVVNVINFFKELPGKIARLLAMAIAKIAAWSLDAIRKARQTGADFLNAVVSFFQQLPGRIAAFLVAAIAKIIDWRNRSIAAARELGSRVLSAVVEFFQQLPGRIAQFVSAAVSAISSAASSAASAARSVGQAAWNGFKGALTGLPGLVSGLFNRAVDAIRGVARRAFNAARQVASDLWNGFKAGLGIRSPSFIEVAMFAITDTVEDQMGNLRSQIRTLQRVGAQLPNAIPREVSVAATAALSGSQLTPMTAGVGTSISNQRGGDVYYSIDTVEIPAKDVKEMQDVSEFFDRIGVVLRQGESK